MKRTGPQPRSEIDLHLAVAEALIPDQPARWSHLEIAQFCGCSRRLIDLTEKEAFRKLRRRLMAFPEIADVFQCPLQAGTSRKPYRLRIKSCTPSKLSTS